MQRQRKKGKKKRPPQSATTKTVEIVKNMAGKWGGDAQQKSTLKCKDESRCTWPQPVSSAMTVSADCTLCDVSSGIATQNPSVLAQNPSFFVQNSIVLSKESIVLIQSPSILSIKSQLPHAPNGSVA